MRWPKEIVAAFFKGMSVTPIGGYTKEQVLQFVLDETARRVVWRAQNDPERVSGCLRWPYTPLGSLVPGGLDGRVERVTLHGKEWGKAVELYYDYFEKNAAAILEVFRDEAEPYDDMSGSYSETETK